MAQKRIFHYMSIVTGELATDWADVLRISSILEGMGFPHPACYLNILWKYSEEGF